MSWIAKWIDLKGSRRRLQSRLDTNNWNVSRCGRSSSVRKGVSVNAKKKNNKRAADDWSRNRKSAKPQPGFNNQWDLTPL